MGKGVPGVNGAEQSRSDQMDEGEYALPITLRISVITSTSAIITSATSTNQH